MFDASAIASQAGIVFLLQVFAYSLNPFFLSVSVVLVQSQALHVRWYDRNVRWVLDTCAMMKTMEFEKDGKKKSEKPHIFLYNFVS